jgi:hypothetical protein
MNGDEYRQLLNRFGALFDAWWDRTELAAFDDLREKFAFHMADVAKDLCDLSDAYRQGADIDSLRKRTEMFFYHCMPHLMAAANIYDYIPKIFDEQQGVHKWDEFEG